MKSLTIYFLLGNTKLPSGKYQEFCT